MAQESLVTYRYKYRSRIEMQSVLELLVTEEINPKSLVYQISHCDEYIQRIGNKSDKSLNAIQKKLLETLTLIRLCNVEVLAAHVERKDRKELKVFLRKVISNLEEVSNLVYRTYFAHSRDQYAFVSKLPEL
jgi:uncharacterized alpha-E superfamily protein